MDVFRRCYSLSMEGALPKKEERKKQKGWKWRKQLRARTSGK
jgi:hypothetical protein